MRWFKHFTDNHRGKSVQYLLDELGYFGPFFKDTILEMCAEKLHQFDDRELTEEDCRFEFHRRVVESATRAKQSTVSRALVLGQSANFWKFETDGEYFKIFAPILLDLLDYDSKKSRARRAKIAPHVALRIEKNRIEYNNSADPLLTQQVVIPEKLVKEKGIGRDRIEEVYQKHYPLKKGKTKGLDRAQGQIKTEDDLMLLIQAIEAYKAECARSNTYLKHFDTFMSSWRDCLDPEYGQRAATKPTTTKDFLP